MENIFLSLLPAIKAQPLSTITILSALISMASAILAWRSSRIARQNLRMAKIDFEEKHDSIRAHLVDSVTWDSEEGERVSSFACSYTNAANAPNTLERIELIVHALNPNGAILTVVLDPTLDEEINERKASLLGMPVNLGARSTVSGWINFKIPEYLLKTKRIERYEVTATSSTGKTVVLETHLLRKVDNETSTN